MDAGDLSALAGTLQRRVAGLAVLAAAGSKRAPGGGTLALAGRRRPGVGAGTVGPPVHADVPLARARSADAVAARLASAQRVLPRPASAFAPHAGSGGAIRQRLCVSIDASPERALHRSRARAVQRPRAGRGLRARALAPRARRSPALLYCLGHLLCARRRRHPGRRPGLRLAAARALLLLLVDRLDRCVRVEARTPEGARDRERSARARAVQRRGGADQRPHQADHGGPTPPPLELPARARRVAPEPGAATARDPARRPDRAGAEPAGGAVGQIGRAHL